MKYLLPPSVRYVVPLRQERPSVFSGLEVERLNNLLTLCTQILHSIWRGEVGAYVRGEVLVEPAPKVRRPILVATERRFTLALFGILEEKGGVEATASVAVRIWIV